MADRQNAIQNVEAAPAVAPDLDPAEFGLALVVAATWYFAGPLGIVPTLFFIYKIVGARAPKLPPALRTFGAGIGWFTQLPIQQKAAYLLSAPGAPEYLPPDEIGDDNGDGAAEGRTQPLAALPVAHAAPRRRTAPASVEEVAQQRGAALLERPLYDSQPDNAWGPTILAAKPRHGKSQVQIARIVADIEAGHETVWMSTHLTLYHSKDQPTDLRPIADKFEHLGQPEAIRDRLRYYVDTVLDERLGKYQRGEDVGHPIALHIGEWPALHARFGEQVAAPMRRLLYEAPKAQIIVSTLDAQDAQVETLGLGSGVRNAFWTKLIGNVDKYSWQGLAPEQPYRVMPAREWYAPGQGVVRFPLPSAERIAQMAAPAPVTRTGHPPMQAPAPDAVRLVRRETGTISPAELARVAPSLAAKRGYAPTVQDAAALAGLLGLDDAPPVSNQQLVIERHEGSGLHVGQRTELHFHGSGRRGAIPGRKVDLVRRRERAEKYQRIRQLVAEGKSANEIDRLEPGERKTILKLVREAKNAISAGPGGS